MEKMLRKEDLVLLMPVHRHACGIKYTLISTPIKPLNLGGKLLCERLFAKAKDTRRSSALLVVCI